MSTEIKSQLRFCLVGISVLGWLFFPSTTKSQVTTPQTNPQRPGVSILERGQPGSTVTPPARPINSSRPKKSPEATSADAGADIDNLITKLVLENIPHTFEETKDWGGQDERWDGIEFRREGLRIETKRKKKEVNHGTWKKYSAQLLNPNEEFSVQLKNMRETPNEKMAFDVHFTAHLKIFGRQSKWVKGVQLYSLSARGHTKVRLVVSMEMGVDMDINRFPPDLVFNPIATDANLVVDEFRLDRVSKAGGEFAQQVSKGVRSSLDEKVAEKKDKLVQKINKQINKNKGKLRLSIADALKSKWTKSVQEALKQK